MGFNSGLKGLSIRTASLLLFTAVLELECIVVSAVIGYRNVSIVVLSVFLVINRSRKLIFSFSSYVNLHLSCLFILFK